ncbi:MAG: nonstructural protein [Microvirus sp.]|nr:MAG: nonstructural protein [Microvirus sp.]
MKYNVFSLYDTKSASYSQPFYSVNADVAVRSVVDLAADKSNAVGKHPGDYSLFCLGSFDDALGSFANLPHPENLGFVSQFMEASNA